MQKQERMFILKTIRHGEADLIVHGLSTGGGQLHFMAKGALKSRKRFGGGVLEPLNYILAHYHLRASTHEDRLNTLLEAQLLRDFAKLRTSYVHMELALYMLQRIHQMSREGVEDAPELFDLLGNALTACETSPDLTKLRFHFELKLVHLQGVLPLEPEMVPWLQVPLAEHAHQAINAETWPRLRAQVAQNLRDFAGS